MTSDYKGRRGESIFVASIMNFCGRDKPYFMPHFLGDKFPASDYLVELIDVDGVVPYFFAQVKTTDLGYEQRKDGQSYLKVRAKRDDLNRLAIYPAPSYLFGIDNILNKGYIVAVDRVRRQGFSGMHTKFPIDCVHLPLLWEEVRAYWSARSMSFSSRFAH